MNADMTTSALRFDPARLAILLVIAKPVNAATSETPTEATTRYILWEAAVRMVLCSNTFTLYQSSGFPVDFNGYCGRVLFYNVRDLTFY